MFFIVWKQNKKQNKNKIRTKDKDNKSKANIKKRKAETCTVKTKTKTTEDENAQKKQFGFQKGMWKRSWFQIKKQTLRKGNKKKDRRNPPK